MSNLLLLENPRRRRRKTTAKRRPARRRKTTARRRRSNPVARRRTTTVRRRRRYASNPIRGGIKGMQRAIMPAATAAVGALGLDVVMGYAPIPANLKVGPMRHLTKGAMAMLLGYASSFVVRRDTANLFTMGMLTTVLHGALRETMTQYAPNIALGEYVSGMGYYGSGMDAGAFNNFGQDAGTPALGEYVSGMGSLTNPVDVYGGPANLSQLYQFNGT